MSEERDGGMLARLEDRADRSSLEVIAARLETFHGHGPARLAAASEMPARDFLAAIAMMAVGTDPDAGPPLVRRSPSKPGLQWAASETTLAEVFPHASRPKRLALSAGLLQMLDFWDASHEAAQEADDLGEQAYSPLWHAIAHRREPDAGNAAYWFRRVGRHATFEDLAEQVEPMLTARADDSLAARLLPRGSWDPLAFVAFCGEASRRPGSEEERLARRIQRVEMLHLLDATAAGLGGREAR